MHRVRMSPEDYHQLYTNDLEWICIQSKELEEQSERLLALAELLLEGDEDNDRRS
tara:strand:- start:514 stop:678 length:165 start_codon:yes stop_codon:yes gene_type:complete